MADKPQEKEDASPQQKKEEEPKAEGAEGSKGWQLYDSVSEKLSSLFSSALKVDDENVEKVLEEVSFAGVAKFLKSDKCKNIITMAGAGISTSAGIPDFRSPESGLYNNLQKYNLPDPMAIFSIEFFKETPEPFFQLCKELWPGHFKPTPCHYFIKQLHDKGKLLRHYTQNIDTLEHHTGLPADKIVEAHGSFSSCHCLSCGKEYSQDWIKGVIFKDKIPHCQDEECKGLVKPDIVFFGERLPDRFIKCMEEDFKKCDLLVIMGTSLSVQPFASLTSRVPVTTPRLYINLDKGQTEMDPFMAMMMGGTTMNFDSESNYRDVFKQATCDDGCYELSDALGWGKELKDTVKKEHARLEKEIAKNKLVAAKGSPKDQQSPKGAGPEAGAKGSPKEEPKKSPKKQEKESPKGGPKAPSKV